MAFVRKRGKVWYARFTDETGAQAERRTKARNKTEAWEVAHDLERRASRVRLGLEVPLEHLTLDELWERYKPVAEALRSWETLEGRYRLHIKPEFGAKQLHLIRADAIEAFLARKQKKDGLSPQTAEHLRVLLSAMFTFAVEKAKVLRESPMRDVAKVKVPQRPPKFLTEEQVVALLKHVPDYWRGLFAVAVYTGLRKGELVGLRVTDVDLPGRMLIVWYTKSGGTTKSGKARFVPIPEELVPYLQVELGRARSTWLFVNKKGHQLSKNLPLPEMFRRALTNAGFVQGFDHVCVTRGSAKGCGLIERRADSAPIRCPKCGRQSWAKPVPLDMSFKDLRSTFGTIAAETTGDLRLVQRALGHADIETTEKRYAFARDRRFQSALAGLSFARSLPAGANETDPNGQTAPKVVNIDERNGTKEAHGKRRENGHGD